MQFKSSIGVVYNTYNEHGETILSEQMALKCTVVNRKKVVSQTAKQNDTTCDMKIITSSKRFSPYRDLMTDDSLTFIYDGTEYSPMMLAEINDFNGRTKYIELELREKKR